MTLSYDQHTSGALTPVTGSPFPTGPKPVALTVSSNGFLYVANANAATVSAYCISSSSGQLTQITGSPFAVGTDSYSVACDPGGPFLYVTNLVSGSISAFSINSTSGSLSAIASYSAGNNRISVAVDSASTPNVADSGSSNASSIDSTRCAYANLRFAIQCRK
jgi:6-phosphogluconolactonase